MNYFKTTILLGVLITSLFGQRIISFEEAMDIAKKNSPEIRQAQINLERNQRLLDAEKAALKSNFSLSVDPFYYEKSRQLEQILGSFNESEQKGSSGRLIISQPVLLTDGTFVLMENFQYQDVRSEFGGDTHNRSFSNNLTLEFNQPLFTYNRTKLALDNVRTDLEYAYFNYIINELSLEQRVTQVFYRVYQNKLALQVAREDKARTEQSYQIILNKVEAGLAAQEELYQAELNLLTSSSVLQNGEVTLQNSLDNFKQVIGLDLNDDITVDATINQKKVEFTLDRAIRLGLANRLELKQRNLDIRNAKTGLITASAINEFKGNLRLSYGFASNDEDINRLADNPRENQVLRLSFDVPIYDWGEAESRKKAAQASIKSSELNLEEEKVNIVIGIRQTHRSLNNQALQIEMAEQNVKIAQQTYDINLERYKNGDLTSMDLNLFQNQLSEKKNSQIDAIINYKLLLLDMKVQTLWDFETDNAVDTNTLNSNE